MSVKKNYNNLKDNNYLSVKVTLNWCVFRRDLKLCHITGSYISLYEM
jgi:hypothetical protein